MKKYLVLFILLVMFVTMFGCKKNDEINNVVEGGWGTVLTEQVTNMSEEEINIFNQAKANYNGMELEAVAVVGRQVVAGTNYMYLAKGNGTYKMVVVYNDLEGNSTITKVTDFEFTKYVNKNSEGNSEQLAGGWYSEVPSKPVMLEEKIQAAFDEAMSTLAGMTFTPIAVVGSQIVAGTNYAILCYGQPSVNPSESRTNLYLITLYEDLSGNGEIISICYVPLEQYN